MSLLLPHSEFYHLTRCGGIFVRKAVREAGVSTNEICKVAKKYFTHPESYMIKRGTILHHLPTDLAKQGRKTFTFIRHPLSWLKSYYRFKQRYGWKPKVWYLDKYCQADNFGEFIDKYLEHTPNQYSKFAMEYTDHVDYVGRQENLAEDLITILKDIGEEFDEQKIRDCEAENVHTNEVDMCYTSGQEKKILETETLVKKFYG